MLTETALEILHFFCRAELEGLQMHSRFLRDFVYRSADKLPLRPIYRIAASPFFGKGLHLWLESGNENNPLVVRELTEGDLGILLALVQNSFVERLEVGFRDLEIGNQNGARCLRHLRDHAGALQCRIKSLRVTGVSVGIDLRHPPAHFDYALVDFLASHLMPHELRVDVYHERQAPQATLFDHVYMRSTLKHVRFYMSFCSATSAIPGLLNVDTVQTCIIDTFCDATPWVIRFARTFEATQRGAKVVQSVTIVRDRCDDDEDERWTPATEAFAPLGRPQRRVIPALPSVCDEQYLRNAVPTEPTAELFLVTNMELRKRLEISKWTVAITAKCDMFECTWPLDIVLLEIIDI